MLLGRDRELAVIDRFLERARGEQAGVLVLRGEAGVGKTALLEYAADRAAAMRVLRTVGLESEGELEFSGLLDIARPLLDKLRGLAPGHSSALKSALGLG